MRTLTGRILAISGILILLGGGLSAAGWFLDGEPGFYIGRKGIHTNREVEEKLYNEKLEGLDKTEIGGFRSIRIRSESADISVKPSANGHFYLEYQLPPQGKQPVYTVENGLFSMDIKGWQSDGMSGIAGFFMSTDSSTHMSGFVTVYVPEDIPMEGIHFNTESGNLDAEGIKTSALTLISASGNAAAEEVTAAKLEVKTESGNTDAEAAGMENGSFESGSGNISLKFTGQETDYNYKIRTESGEIELNGRSGGERLNEDHGAGRNIAVTTGSGGVVIDTEHSAYGP